MAKKKTGSRKRSGSTKVVAIRPAAAKPIVIRQTAAPVKRRRSGGRRRHSGGGGGLSGLTDKAAVAALAGAFVLGYLDKQGTKLPTIPLVGRAGTVGLAMYYSGKQFNMPHVKQAALGPLSIALYQFGRDGKVAGVDGDIDGVDPL